MKKLRVVGGILVGFGTSLAGIAALGAAGLFPLSIDFFGYDLSTRFEYTVWIASWAVVALVGFVLLYYTRDGRRGTAA